MNDDRQGQPVGGLPPCPMSKHCLRLIDLLDRPATTSLNSHGVVDTVDEEDRQDQQLAAQLHIHIPTCATCQATAAQARSMHMQQRTLLRSLIAEGEQRVPSTLSSILSALKKEAETPHITRETHFPIATNKADETMAIQPEEPIEPLPFVPRYRSAREARPIGSRRRFSSLLSSIAAFGVVAAIVLFSCVLFSRFGALHFGGGSAATTSGSANMPVASLTDWNTVILLRKTNNQTHVEKLDPATGIITNLGQADATLVSADGHHLAYAQHAADGTTSFYTLQGLFYKSASAASAIWMSDNRSVLITTLQQGVLKVDTVTGKVQAILPTLKTAGLAFYHTPYLYFVGAEDRATNALYRVNIDAKEQPKQVTARSPNTTFWLSPDGATVYYVNKGSSGRQGIYTVHSDGTGLRLLRSDGIPIGYAADNALMTMRQVNGKFQIIKIGANPTEDTVILDDTVPGASSICTVPVPAGVVPVCDAAVALAPYGNALVVNVGYADGSYALWSLDLMTGARSRLTTAGGFSYESLQLIGWSKQL